MTDNVYRVYVNDEDKMILGDLHFDVNNNNDIIINNISYSDTQNLFELIFKRIPDDSLYTETDKQNYKKILLPTDVHKCYYKMHKRYKYKHIVLCASNFSSK